MGRRERNRAMTAAAAPSTRKDVPMITLEDGSTMPEDEAMSQASREWMHVYSKWVFDYQVASHHMVWINLINQLLDGSIGKDRLLIIAPPGCAKSTYFSLVFPCWYLGKNPSHSFGLATSTDAMSRQFGGTVRDCLDSNIHHRMTFPEMECWPDMLSHYISRRKVDSMGSRSLFTRSG